MAIADGRIILQVLPAQSRLHTPGRLDKVGCDDIVVSQGVLLDPVLMNNAIDPMNSCHVSGIEKIFQKRYGQI